MSQPATCLVDRSRVVDLYFMEHRAKLIDLAAFLDRVDRARDDDADAGGDDFRMQAFRRALAVLQEPQPGRARRVLELFSDHTTDPLDSAAGLKGAHGAPPPPA